MSDVVDLSTERVKRENPPDAQFVTTDEAGRPMYAFALEFKHDGGTWSVSVFAYDCGDAERRVLSMRESLAVRGQLYAGFPA